MDFQSVSNFNNVTISTTPVILTGSFAKRGMSGSPVFNGCVLVGVLNARYYRYVGLENSKTYYYDDCMTIAYINALQKLLENPKAKAFAKSVNVLSSQQFVTSPTKTYCEKNKLKYLNSLHPELILK
jgi:hypothetical protein